MQNYYSGLTISVVLHLGIVMSFANFFQIDLLYSVQKYDPMPVYLIYEKSEAVLKEKKVNKIKKVVSEKLIPYPPVIQISSSKTELANIEIEKTLLSKERSQLGLIEVVDEILLYSNRIRDQVMVNWKPPALSNFEFKSELIITLVPTGEIINVKISKGSGNKAFDRSALAAIEKVGRFDNLDMRRKLFDEHFRNFTLVFNPRD